MSCSQKRKITDVDESEVLDIESVNTSKNVNYKKYFNIRGKGGAKTGICRECKKF